MDKNTITGLILMAAIFFGFMYLSRPSKEELEARREAAAKKAEQQNSPVSEVALDSITPEMEGKLKGAVRTLGAETSEGRYAYTDDNFDLKADSTGVNGTVNIEGKEINLADLRTTSGGSMAATERAAALKNLNELVSKVLKYQGLASRVGGVNKVDTLENAQLRLLIDSKGGMISQAVLKDYKTEVGKHPGDVELFQGDKDGYSFILTTADQRIDTREFNFTSEKVNDSTLVMSLPLGNGATWSIRYTLRPDYLVGMEIEQSGISEILPASTASADFHWHQTMARNEKGRSFEERNSAIYYKYFGDSPDDMSESKDDSEQLAGRIKWVAFKNQFFSSVIIPREYFSNADLTSYVIKNSMYLKDMDMAATLPYSTTDGVAAAFDWYLGPNNYPLLKGISKNLCPDENLDLTRLIPLGWGLFRYINIWIVIPVFTFLSSFISNYGIIILLLTIFIKLIIFPFTFKSYKSQARMRVLQPEIKAINEKYPGQENAMKRQQETMALYNRSGASPFSGCLPMLFQMPVLIAMFSFFPSSIELRGESFLWAKDLSAPDYIFTLPFSIPFYGNGVSLFCLLMTAVNIIYMRINMQNQPGGDSMPGMKWMSYIMPIMFLFIFNDYASGLSYYYFLSLLITILQTWVFRRFIVDEKKVREEMLANAKKPRKKSGLMARLEEAQKRQQAMLRQQQAAQGKKSNKR